MDTNYEYRGYSLDDTSQYDLSDEDKVMLDAIIWIIDNNDSIRGSARNNLIPKSSIHLYIHSKLSSISGEIYGSVIKIISTNKRRLCHRRLSK